MGVHALYFVSNVGAAARRLVDRSTSGRGCSSASPGCCAASAGAAWVLRRHCQCSTRCMCCRHRRCARLQRLYWIGAQMVQHAAWPGVRDHGGRIRWWCGALHAVYLVDDRVAGIPARFLVTGAFQGIVILIVAQFLCHPPIQPAAAATAAGGRVAIGQAAFHDRRDGAHAAVLRDVFHVRLMATGGLLVTANAGPMARSWGFTRGAHAGATLSPLANGASRIFWGWASDRIGREMAMVHRVRAPGDVSGPGGHGRPISGAVRRSRWCSVYFTWGEIYSLFPSTVRRLLRHATRHLELRRAVHGEGCGGDHRRMGRRAAL